MDAAVRRIGSEAGMTEIPASLRPRARHDGEPRVIAGLTRNPFMSLLDCIRKAFGFPL
jgi:hypothetical protein